MFVNLVMTAFTKFSESTSLISNPRKCKIYFKSVDNKVRSSIKESTGFDEGQLPVRYLGVPLTSKKLSI